MSASYFGLYEEGEGEISQRDRSLSLKVTGSSPVEPTFPPMHNPSHSTMHLYGSQRC